MLRPYNTRTDSKEKPPASPPYTWIRSKLEQKQPRIYKPRDIHEPTPLEPEDDDGNLETPIAEFSEDEEKERPLERKPLRAARFSSLYYFLLCQRIWHVLVYSWPLDAVLFTYLDLRAETAGLAPVLYRALAIALVLAAAFFIREEIVSSILYLSDARERLTSYAQKYALWIIGGVALLIFIEVSIRLGGISLKSLFIALIITLGALQSLWRGLRQGKEHKQALEEDWVLHIEEANFRLFLFFAVPMIAARAVSLLGVLIAVADGQAAIIPACWMLASLLLLFAAQPTLEQFTITCRRCARRTSRALKRSGLCPSCEQLKDEGSKIPDLKASANMTTNPGSIPTIKVEAPRNKQT